MVVDLFRKYVEVMLVKNGGDMRIFKVGMVISFIYLIVVFVFIGVNGLTVMKSWNEFGDFLAGLFSPVAFLWLVLGYLQQQKELQQNTEALRLQAEELKNSVDQYKQMVSIAKEQLTSDLTKIQDEKLIRENQHKPDIKIGALRFQSRSGGIYTFKTEVYSDQREARNVLIEFVNGFGNYKKEHRPVVKSSFFLRENQMRIDELPEEVEVIITFESVLGKKYKHRYRYFNRIEGTYQSIEHQELVPE